MEIIRNMFRYSPLFLLMCAFFSFSAFSLPSDHKSVARGLKLIDEARSNYLQGKKKILKRNPLENKKVDSYLSYSYLSYYSAIALFLVAESNQNLSLWNKIKNLKQSYTKLREHLLYDNVDKEDIEQWSERVLHLIIKYSYRQKTYFQSLHFAEKLSNPNTSQELTFYIMMSLIHTKQYTSLKRLMLTDLRAFKKMIDHPLFKKERWAKEKIKGFLQEIEIASSTENKKNTAFSRTQQNCLEDRNAIYEHLKSHPHDKKSRIHFKKCLSLYFKYKKKGDKSLPSEKDYVSFVERRAKGFPPDLMVTMIGQAWKKNYMPIAAHVSLAFTDKYAYHPSYPQVLYDLGRLYEDMVDYKSSLSLFEEAAVKLRGTRYYEMALYRRAWLSYLSVSPKANGYFKDYLDAFPEGKFADSCAYYSIVLREKEVQGKRKISNLLDKDIRAYLEKYPLNLYSLLLGKKRPEIFEEVFGLLLNPKKQVKLQVGSSSRGLFPLSLRDQKRLLLLKEMKALGLKKEAWFILNRLPKRPFHLEFARLYISLSKDLSYYPGLTLRSFQTFLESSETRNEQSLKNIFPAFKEKEIATILARQKSTHLSPALVMSLIRQESAFDHLATSSANAHGLMQLIPSTASFVGAKMGRKKFDMKNSRDNMDFGIYYLSSLAKKFSGKLHYALASYNAGPAITESWVTRRSHLGPLEFIDSIPYLETRSYVKLILRNYIFYQLIYKKKKIRTIPPLHSQVKVAIK